MKKEEWDALVEDAKTAGFQTSFDRIVFNSFNRLIDVETQLTKFAQLQKARARSNNQEGIVVGGWQLKYCEREWVLREVYDNQQKRIEQLEAVISKKEGLIPNDFFNWLDAYCLGATITQQYLRDEYEKMLSSDEPRDVQAPKDILREAINEGRASIIVEGADDSIDGGVIFTDYDDAIEAIAAAPTRGLKGEK